MPYIPHTHTTTHEGFGCDRYLDAGWSHDHLVRGLELGEHASGDGLEVGGLPQAGVFAALELAVGADLHMHPALPKLLTAQK
jgi:hypothetical protein